MRYGKLLAGGLLTAVIGAMALTPGTADPLDPAQAAPQASATAVPWDGGLDALAPCPEGRSRSDSLSRQRFGDGIPQRRYNNGWTNASGSLDGPAARSAVSSGDSVDWMYLDWAQAPVGATTMLAFASTGNAPSTLARANVNSVSKQVAPAGTWSGRVYDITAATEDESGRLGPWFQHKRASGRSQTWWVDNVQIYTCGRNSTDRIHGANRYDTSARISSLLDPGVEVAYLASGSDFPDALGGSALAVQTDSPVLMVPTTGLPEETKSELQRLKPERIVVLGGTRAVPDRIMELAEPYATTGVVDRIAGANRYETAVAISSEFPADIGTVYIATGTDYPDALAGGAHAGRRGSPLLFTHPDGVPSVVRAELERLNPRKIVILGGTSAVPANQEKVLRSYTRDGKLVRIAGADRYATAAKIAAYYPSGGSRVFVATGTGFPDALSGAAVAGSMEVPVLLTRQDSLPSVAASRINRLDPDRGTVLGGTSAVSPLVRDQLGAVID